MTAHKADEVHDTKSRVILLLPDGLDYRLTHRYLDSMPNTRRIMDEGYSGQILPFSSTWGNINYGSLVTGSPPGANYRENMLQGQQSAPGLAMCAAETLWQALASENRRSALIDFASTGPYIDELIAVVAPPAGSVLFGSKVHQTPDIQTGIYDLSKIDRSGWPPGRGPTACRSVQQMTVPREYGASLETTIVLTEGLCWRVVIPLKNGAPDRVEFYRPGESSPATEVMIGRWTDWVEGVYNNRRFKVRFRLLSISSDGKSVELLMSSGCYPDGICNLPELGKTLLLRLGSYDGRTAIQPHPEDPHCRIGMEEVLDGAHWVINAAEIAFQEWGAELFVHKNSIVDSANHQCAAMIDPYYHRYDATMAKSFDKVLRQAYMDLDNVIGHMLDVAERAGNTHIVITGDHGISINNVVCDVNRRLRDMGMLFLNADDTIDMSRTYAYTKRTRQGNEIFVNLCGRESTGIVEPSDYQEVQEQIIDALLDWRDPQGKKRVVCFALPRQHAPIAAYWGPECGDVIFAYNPGFSWGVNPDGETTAMSTSPTTNHGAAIQTQDTGVTSNMGMLLAWGPKVKVGVRRDVAQLGPIPIHNVGVSVSRLLGCRPPMHASGGLILDMF